MMFADQSHRLARTFASPSGSTDELLDKPKIPESQCHNTSHKPLVVQRLRIYNYCENPAPVAYWMVCFKSPRKGVDKFDVALQKKSVSSS